MKLRIVHREWGCSEKDWIGIEYACGSSYYQLQQRVRIKGKYKWIKVPIKELE